MANPGKLIQIFSQNLSFPCGDSDRFLENSSIFSKGPGWVFQKSNWLMPGNLPIKIKNENVCNLSGLQTFSFLRIFVFDLFSESSLMALLIYRIGWDCSLTCVNCNLWHHSLCGWNWPCGTCCKAILSTHIKLHSRIKGHIKLPLKYNCAYIQLLFMVSELRVSEKKTFSFLFPLSEHFLVVAKGPKMRSSMFSRSEIQKKETPFKNF